MRARGNSEQDIANLHAAIAQVAGSHGIDDRVLIAMIMQESHGQVNTANAWDGQDTPGLMQAMGCPNHAGAATVSKVCESFSTIWFPLLPAKQLPMQNGEGRGEKLKRRMS